MGSAASDAQIYVSVCVCVSEKDRERESCASVREMLVDRFIIIQSSMNYGGVVHSLPGPAERVPESVSPSRSFSAQSMIIKWYRLMQNSRRRAWETKMETHTYWLAID